LVVVPHWNQAVVGLPFGLTVPLSVALLVVLLRADRVEASGGPGCQSGQPNQDEINSTEHDVADIL